MLFATSNNRNFMAKFLSMEIWKNYILIIKVVYINTWFIDSYGLSQLISMLSTYILMVRHTCMYVIMSWCWLGTGKVVPVCVCPTSTMLHLDVSCHDHIIAAIVRFYIANSHMFMYTTFCAMTFEEVNIAWNY